MTDETLFAQFQAGDESAFAELVNRYRLHLTRYIEGQIGSASADDVCQSVFIRVAHHRSAFSSGDLFRPWLYAITDRITRQYQRDKRLERQQLDSLEMRQLAEDFCK